jgi:hypothetical protein
MVVTHGFVLVDELLVVVEAADLLAEQGQPVGVLLRVRTCDGAPAKNRCYKTAGKRFTSGNFFI